jgi:outer membrane protein TolC
MSTHAAHFRPVLPALFLYSLVAAPGFAHAQQPLERFLEAIDEGNLDVRAARAVLSQAQGQVDEARARLLPNANVTGTYTRNEREVVIQIPDPEMGAREATFQPQDQLDARFVVAAPILDLSAWATFLSAESLADAADQRAGNAQREARATVVLLWHQVVASRSFVRAAERTLEVAEQNRNNAQARTEVGAAPQLELARAEAEVQRARQSLAEAQLSATLSARNLQNATGITPSDAEVELEDDLHEEPALDRFLAEIEHHPLVSAARYDALAAERSEHAAWLTLAPTVTAQFAERLTNAAGFGPNNQWAASVTATWQFDFVRPASIGTRGAAAELARIRAEQARQQVETAIFEAWQRVATQRVRAEAARAALEASARAVSDARARYDTGAATQLELIQAERDLFSAEVARIQADADLRIARLVLRIRSGVETR